MSFYMNNWKLGLLVAGVGLWALSTGSGASILVTGLLAAFWVAVMRHDLTS